MRNPPNSRPGPTSTRQVRLVLSGKSARLNLAHAPLCAFNRDTPHLELESFWPRSSTQPNRKICNHNESPWAGSTTAALFFYSNFDFILGNSIALANCGCLLLIGIRE